MPFHIQQQSWKHVDSILSLHVTLINTKSYKLNIYFKKNIQTTHIFIAPNGLTAADTLRSVVCNLTLDG